MSSTENHKKAINITASCRGKKGLMTDIYYKILEDHPAAIVNAAAALESGVKPRGVLLESLSAGNVNSALYQCPDCKEFVDKIGLGGACIKCDVAGFDAPY